MVTNSYTGQVLRPIKMKGQGKIGDYANINKLEGNFDVLEEIDGTMSGWGHLVTLDDESTWPVWIRRKAQGFNQDAILYNFQCECGDGGEPIEDKYRGEVYCQACGYVNDGTQSYNKSDDDALQAWEEAQYDDIAEEIGQEWNEDEGEYAEYDGSEIWAKKQSAPQLEEVVIYIKETPKTFSFRNMVTGEMITQTILTTTAGWRGASKSVSLGVTEASRYERKLWHARRNFDDHFHTCDGNPGNCLECHKTDKILQKLIMRKLN